MDVGRWGHRPRGQQHKITTHFISLKKCPAPVNITQRNVLAYSLFNVPTYAWWSVGTPTMGAGKNVLCQLI